MAVAADLFQTSITAQAAAAAAADAADTAAALNQLSCIRYTREELLSLNSPRLRPLRRVRKTLFAAKLWQPASARAAQLARIGGVGIPTESLDSTMNNNNIARPRPESADSVLPFIAIGWLNVHSLPAKTNAIVETIGDKTLDILVLTETWHHASDDISLRRATPPGYACVDAVRPDDPAHGGIVVLHKKQSQQRSCEYPPR